MKKWLAFLIVSSLIFCSCSSKIACATKAGKKKNVFYNSIQYGNQKKSAKLSAKLVKKFNKKRSPYKR